MMFKNDWVSFGFGEEMIPHSDHLPFYIDYSGADGGSNTKSPLELAIDNAVEIYETMPKPLTLMVSGGVDSQAMAYTFKKAGIPFRAVFARYNDGLNDHDFHTSVFFRQNDIPVSTLEIDLIAFHEREIFDWAARYQNNSPHFLSHLYIASQLPGTVVSSGCIVRRPNIGHMSYSAFGLERYGRISGQPVIGYFLNYSPELVCAVATLPGEKRFLADTKGYEQKLAAYHAAGFPVRRQPRKYHGFERLKEYYDSEKVSASIRMKYRKEPSSRPYDLLFRYPLKDICPYSDASMTIFPKDK